MLRAGFGRKKDCSRTALGSCSRASTTSSKQGMTLLGPSRIGIAPLRLPTRRTKTLRSPWQFELFRHPYAICNGVPCKLGGS